MQCTRSQCTPRSSVQTRKSSDALPRSSRSKQTFGSWSHVPDQRGRAPRACARQPEQGVHVVQVPFDTDTEAHPAIESMPLRSHRPHARNGQPSSQSPQNVAVRTSALCTCWRQSTPCKCRSTPTPKRSPCSCRHRKHSRCRTSCSCMCSLGARRSRKAAQPRGRRTVRCRRSSAEHVSAAHVLAHAVPFDGHRSEVRAARARVARPAQGARGQHTPSASSCHVLEGRVRRRARAGVHAVQGTSTPTPKRSPCSCRHRKHTRCRTSRSCMCSRRSRPCTCPTGPGSPLRSHRPQNRSCRRSSQSTSALRTCWRQSTPCKCRSTPTPKRSPCSCRHRKHTRCRTSRSCMCSRRSRPCTCPKPGPGDLFAAIGRSAPRVEEVRRARQRVRVLASEQASQVALSTAGQLDGVEVQRPPSPVAVALRSVGTGLTVRREPRRSHVSVVVRAVPQLRECRTDFAGRYAPPAY